MANDIDALSDWAAVLVLMAARTREGLQWVVTTDPDLPAGHHTPPGSPRDLDGGVAPPPATTHPECRRRAPQRLPQCRPECLRLRQARWRGGQPPRLMWPQARL